MELLNIDMKTMAYIRSEAEFNRARMKAFWDFLLNRVTGRRTHLLSFNEMVEKSQLDQALYLGLQDIPIKNIVGSVGRYRDFTPHFYPCISDAGGKERWRILYAIAVSGARFPPVEVYKIGKAYFVKNGHHRISVATYLNWTTIQACVTELPLPMTGDSNLDDQ